MKWKQGENATAKDVEDAKKMAENIASSDTIAGEHWREIEQSKKTVTIEVNTKRYNDATPGNNSKLNPIEAVTSAIGIGGDAYVRFDPTDYNTLSDGTVGDAESTLAHEVSGHAYSMVNGINPITQKGRELEATAVENQYRASKGIEQRNKYGDKWEVEKFSVENSHRNTFKSQKNKTKNCSK